MVWLKAGGADNNVWGDMLTTEWVTAIEGFLAHDRAGGKRSTTNGARRQHLAHRGEVAIVHSNDLMDDLVGHSLVVHGKGGKRRIVPLPQSLGRTLAQSPSGFLFPGDDGGHLSPRYVGKLIRDLLPGEWTMHTLRHRFGTRAYALTSDLLLVQEMLGHASPSTTRRYVEYDRNRMRSAVEELAS